MDTLLKIENIKMKFGKNEVLKGIHLDIHQGEIISVLGPSGCGKSTLLKIIAGILSPSEGSVQIGERIVSAKNIDVPTEKRDVNMVFQDFALWPHMTVRNNITFGLKIKKQEKAEIEKKLNEVVELLHLEGLVERYPAELSGGQQQRVAIARALITNPTIVLLDEPLCNLDIQLRIEMRTEMAHLFKRLKTTVFHVTHDPSEAFAMADRIIVMNNGHIDQIDTPSDCYASPKTPIVAGLLGAGNSIKKAELISSQDGYAMVKIGSSELACKSFITEQNESRQIRFRPEDAIFSETKSGNAIKVKIIVSTFEGSCCRVRAETEDGECISFLHETKLDAGREGFLSVANDKLYVY